MKVTVIPIIVGTLETVPKGLVRRLEKIEIGGCVKTIETIALLRSTRILRRNKQSWEERERERAIRNRQSFSFSVEVLVCDCSLVPFSLLHVERRTLSRSPPKMGTVIFGSPSYHRVLIQLTFFSCFLSCFLINAFSVWVSSRQSERVTDFLLINPGVRSYPNLDAHLSICFSLIAFFSLCLWLPRTYLSYLSLPFHHPLVDL